MVSTKGCCYNRLGDQCIRRSLQHPAMFTFYAAPKGQLISKFLFGVFNFLQKTNENKSTGKIIVVK
jgi:hypothetical protein